MISHLIMKSGIKISRLFAVFCLLERTSITFKLPATPVISEIMRDLLARLISGQFFTAGVTIYRDNMVINGDGPVLIKVIKGGSIIRVWWNQNMLVLCVFTIQLVQCYEKGWAITSLKSLNKRNTCGNWVTIPLSYDIQKIFSKRTQHASTAHVLGMLSENEECDALSPR
jgi:hypothetical protein